MTLRLLDLFCGAGGAAMGYHRAGFEVVGVDNDRRPLRHYPFACIQADAMTFPLRGFDVIHASPPCQDFSAMANVTGRRPGTGWMLTKTLERLEASGLPFVMENVPGAPIPWNLRLCGESFGLETIRHRVFVTRPFLLGPQCCHVKGGTVTGRYVAFRHSGSVAPGRTVPPRRSEVEHRRAMGTEWMPLCYSRQSIPPAYTEWIGSQLAATHREPIQAHTQNSSR